MLTLFIIMFFIKRGRIRQKNRLSGKRSVNEAGYITLGGSRQYITLRGEDDRNPLMLFLHGGPGAPISCVSYVYQRELEGQLTVVNWDQRGSGRSYYEPPSASPVTAEELLGDLHELIGHLRARFPERRLYLLGFSYGSALALKYLSRFPDAADAYIAVGQCVSIPEGIRVNTERALCTGRLGATKAADIRRLSRELLRLSPDASASSDRGILCYLRLQKLFAGSIACGKEKSLAEYLRLGSLSPSLGIRDLRWKLRQCFNGRGFIADERELMSDLFLDFDARELADRLSVPVCFISGEGDYTTPVELVRSFAAGLSEHRRMLLTVRHAGHSPMFEQPEAFCLAVKKAVRFFEVALRS